MQKISSMAHRYLSEDVENISCNANSDLVDTSALLDYLVVVPHYLIEIVTRFRDVFSRYPSCVGLRARERCPLGTTTWISIAQAPALLVLHNCFGGYGDGV